MSAKVNEELRRRIRNFERMGVQFKQAVVTSVGPPPEVSIGGNDPIPVLAFVGAGDIAVDDRVTVAYWMNQHIIVGGVTDSPSSGGGGSYSPPIPQSDVTGLVAALAAKAALASPTFTGTPAAPTAGGGTNTTQIATTAFVTAAINALSSVYQAADAELSAIAGLTSAANKLPYFTGSGTAALADLTAAGRAILDDADAAAQRTTLGLAIGTNVQAWDADLDAIAALTTTAYGRSVLATADAAALRTLAGLGSIATQAASNVTITGGSVTGITDLTVTDGGTGASNASGARTNLGLVIGTDVAPVASPAFTGNPTAPTPATGDNDTSVATTAFVEARAVTAAAGFSSKEPADYATTAALPAYTVGVVTSGFVFTPGVGAPDGNLLGGGYRALQANANGALTVDGTAVAAGDDILVKDESGANEKYNGYLTVVNAGSAGSKWLLIRDQETYGTDWYRPQILIPVISGTANGGRSYYLSVAGAVTLDTTALTFVQFPTRPGTGQVGVNEISTAIAGDGLTGGGGADLDVVTGAGLEISSDTVRIAAAAAGDGLTGGAGSALAVNPGTALSITSDALGIKNFAAPVTSLPGSPNDGDLCLFDPSGWTITGTADLVADVTWMLRYRSSTGKWHFVGGDPLVAKVDTSEAKTAGAAYAALTTAGPGVTCAIAGDYQVQVGADIWATNIAAGFMSYDVGGTGALDVDSAKAQISSAITWLIQGASPPRRKTVTATQAFLAKYKSTTNTTNYEKRWMSVLPVRLG